MAHWECTKCGYHVEDETPPEECPSCHEKCLFNNITCYVPECGGEKNIDPRLAGRRDKYE
jgi:rubredoxin